MAIAVNVRNLGRQRLEPVWAEMQRITNERDASSADELWLVEHAPVFTLGLNADPSHVLNPHEIPVVQIDRGGQVTYHGPGQLVAYALVDLRRRGLTVRGLVERLESVVIDTVARYDVEARGRRDAPGVYVGDAKLAAIGLRVRRHCSYHGIAINVAMDLEPFSWINPCGFQQLRVTQLSELCGMSSLARLRADLEIEFRTKFD
jgi:lipoyl(octanoyl) transferase